VALHPKIPEKLEFCTLLVTEGDSDCWNQANFVI